MAITTPTTPAPSASGVRVLDKVSVVLTVLERGPATIAGLVAETGIARGTVTRLVNAMAEIGLAVRAEGKVIPGPRTARLAATAQRVREATTRGEILDTLRADTGASAARLIQRHGPVGTTRLCIAEALDPAATEATQLGMPMPLRAGPVTQVFLAWERPSAADAAALRAAAPCTAATLARTRQQGWAQGRGGPNREFVLLAAPVRNLHKQVVAAVTISGPVDVLTAHTGRAHSQALLDATREIARPLRGEP